MSNQRQHQILVEEMHIQAFEQTLLFKYKTDQHGKAYTTTEFQEDRLTLHIAQHILRRLYLDMPLEDSF